MCGRSVATLDRNLEKLFSWSNLLTTNTDMSPGHHVNVVLHNAKGEMGQCGFRWEFEPESARFYNARLETVFQRNMWHESFESRRGIMMLESFWEKSGHFSAANGEALLVGCIWKAKPLRMVSMLTMEASPLVATVHNRMPAFVPRHLVDAWLDPSANAKFMQAAVLGSSTPSLEVV